MASKRQEAQAAEDIYNAAIRQLRRSERGTQVLKNFVKLMEEGGTGMDSFNFDALELLLVCVRDGHVGWIAELKEQPWMKS